MSAGANKSSGFFVFGGVKHEGARVEDKSPAGAQKKEHKMRKSPAGEFYAFRKPARKINPMPRRTHDRIVELPKPQIDDRVQVPNGLGTVVEISGDMYLVDLENQTARLWERLSSIKLLSKSM